VIKASTAIKEGKGWLIVGGVALAVGVALYFFVKKAAQKVGSDVAALPGQLVAGAADAVGQFGLATNDALGGIPGNIGNAAVEATQKVGVYTGLSSETYTGFEYGPGGWVKVEGLTTGNVYNLDSANNVLDSSGKIIGHFSG
jgi:hypothetical protein